MIGRYNMCAHIPFCNQRTNEIAHKRLVTFPQYLMYFDDYWQVELEVYQKTIEMLFVYHSLYNKHANTVLSAMIDNLCQN